VSGRAGPGRVRKRARGRRRRQDAREDDDRSRRLGTGVARARVRLVRGRRTRVPRRTCAFPVSEPYSTSSVRASVIPADARRASPRGLGLEPDANVRPVSHGKGTFSRSQVDLTRTRYRRLSADRSVASVVFPVSRPPSDVEKIPPPRKRPRGADENRKSSQAPARCDLVERRDSGAPRSVSSFVTPEPGFISPSTC
jgi:hypothetical protein